MKFFSIDLSTSFDDAIAYFSTCALTSSDDAIAYLLTLSIAPSDDVIACKVVDMRIEDIRYSGQINQHDQCHGEGEFVVVSGPEEHIGERFKVR